MNKITNVSKCELELLEANCEKRKCNHCDNSSTYVLETVEYGIINVCEQCDEEYGVCNHCGFVCLLENSCFVNAEDERRTCFKCCMNLMIEFDNMED